MYIRNGLKTQSHSLPWTVLSFQLVPGILLRGKCHTFVQLGLLFFIAGLLCLSHSTLFNSGCHARRCTPLRTTGAPLSELPPTVVYLVGGMSMYPLWLRVRLSGQPALPSCLEQYNRCRHAHVQTLHASPHRYHNICRPKPTPTPSTAVHLPTVLLHPAVARITRNEPARPGVRGSVGLVPEHQHKRFCPIHLSVSHIYTTTHTQVRRVVTATAITNTSTTADATTTTPTTAAPTASAAPLAAPRHVHPWWLGRWRLL